MNLLLFSAKDRLDTKRIVVSDNRLQHLLQVLRAKPGDRIRIGELGGLMGHGEILELGAERAVLRIGR